MNDENPVQLNDERAQYLLKQEELKLYYCRLIHDIKAPIASIIGLVRLSRKKMEDPESQIFFDGIENHFRVIETEIFSSLKNGLFNSENIEANAIDLNEVLNEVVKLLSYSRQMSGIHFHTIVKQDRYFNINRQLVFSILQNIIDNSLKHGRVSDDQVLNIHIQLKQLNSSIIIDIMDDGVGISERTKKKLFENFNSSNDLLFKDNGLGLFIIKKTVEKLNGHLAIGSDEGKGTKFSICIPEAL